jgi:hypothetical protein
VFKLLLLLLSVVVMDKLAQRHRKSILTREEEEQELAEAWQEPWFTSDWSILYGLIALSHENKIEPQHTPFKAEYMSSIQARFKRPQRWALRRLLERGVIPLRINDGGVSTTRTATWGVSLAFPFIQLPRYQQTKSRAYLEFVIPHPEQAGVKHLFKILAQNRMSYGISTRTYNHNTQKSKTCSPSKAYPRNRPKSGPGFPLSLGAQSTCEALLPFLPDTQMRQAQGARVDWLDSYITSDTEGRQDGQSQSDSDMIRVPLLQHSSWVIVRIEAPHWGYVELDNFVLGAVEESGMEARWTKSVCESRAVTRLGKLGLEI